MIRGTTPTLEFTLPFDTSELSESWVTLSQNGGVVLEKRLTDCECDEKKLTVQLTQDETLLFDCSCKAELQIRVRTVTGEALASDIIKVNIERVLKEGVI